MRILIIHNKYQQPGGEDSVFDEEGKLLEESEEVRALIFQNLPGFKGALQFFFSFWNFAGAAKIQRTIKEFNPDLVHLHNWHYAIGPIVVKAVKKNRIPLVFTAHNFRVLCPSAILLHNGSLFLDSLHRDFPWEAVRKRVYRNSSIQTFWLAWVVWFHKKIGTWKMIDVFIVQTPFSKDIFLSSALGIDKSKFFVKPNFVNDTGRQQVDKKDFFLFVGRLSEEKGIRVVLNAFKNSELQLFIAGQGPLMQEVLDACQHHANIHYTGVLPRNEVQSLMLEATALIFPSIWYECMPMTLIESLAAGTPVIASNIGAMLSMITNGYNGIHFNVGDAGDLKNKISNWSTLPKYIREEYSENARITYEKNYTPQENKRLLLSIYLEATRKNQYPERQ